MSASAHTPIKGCDRRVVLTQDTSGLFDVNAAGGARDSLLEDRADLGSGCDKCAKEAFVSVC